MLVLATIFFKKVDHYESPSIDSIKKTNYLINPSYHSSKVTSLLELPPKLDRFSRTYMSPINMCPLFQYITSGILWWSNFKEEGLSVIFGMEARLFSETMLNREEWRSKLTCKKVILVIFFMHVWNSISMYKELMSFFSKNFWWCFPWVSPLIITFPSRAMVCKCVLGITLQLRHAYWNALCKIEIGEKRNVWLPTCRKVQWYHKRWAPNIIMFRKENYIVSRICMLSNV